MVEGHLEADLQSALVFSASQKVANSVALAAKSAIHTSKMTQIPTHENQTIRRSSDKCTNMSSRMSGRIKHIQTPIPKIIPSIKLANLQIERRLNDLPIFKVFLPKGGAFFGGVAGEKLVFETRTDD